MKRIAPIKPIRPKGAVGEVTDWRAFHVKALETWLAFVRAKAKGKSRKKRATPAASKLASSDHAQPPAAQARQGNEADGADNTGHIDKRA